MAPDEKFVLPPFLITPADIRRTKRELETLNASYEQARMQTELGQRQYVGPTAGTSLKALAELNGVDIANPLHRKHLSDQLSDVADNAPVLHFSFAATPPADFTSKIVIWLRSNIHPLALMQIGLQPSVAAGFVLKTPGHFYDFSIRKHLDAQKPALIEALKAVAGKHE